ncbi:MAG: rhodanese-like domain-containing protein [Candidatus Methanospirare jalkutatii]|nr:rhodanese-like domain-containing protein [Candidatus Methanospirare jalkutatii]
MTGIGARRGIMCCCALLLILCLTTATSATPKISISPSFIEVSPGENFTIEIKIEPNGAEIYGVQYDLYFNPDILKAISQSQGNFLSQDGANTIVLVNEINNTIGKIEYVETRMGVEKGVKEAGVLSSISFEVIGTGRSELKLSNVILSDTNATPIEATIESGTVVVSAPATPATTASPALSPEHSPTPTCTAPTYTDITIEDAYKMYEENPTQITFLDVRTEEEYNAEHILDAVNIPLSELEGGIGELDATKKIIVYSQSGKISRDACEILAENGFHAYNMLGGLDAWRLKYPELLYKPPTPSPSPPLPTLSPTPTPTTTPSSPLLSPTPSAAAASPIPAAATTPSPHTPQGWKQIPGFGVAIAVASLALSYFMRRKRRM